MRRDRLVMLLVLGRRVPRAGAASAGLSDRYAVSTAGTLVDPEIDALASTPAGRPVTVICEWIGGIMYGWVGVGWDVAGSRLAWPDELHLGGDRCGMLDVLLHPDQHRAWIGGDPRLHGRPTSIWSLNVNLYQSAVAEPVLVHESMHLRLESLDEGVVERSAIRNLCR